MPALFRLTLFMLILSWSFSCRDQHSGTKPPVARSTGEIEAREDSPELVAAYARQALIQLTITPDAETRAIHARSEEDAADDPAIWCT
ncbi:MAG: phytase [Saprospiraceae bacterium]|nr:phytase [Saprospiraceae bacterium]